jgi:hypothetical protein
MSETRKSQLTAKPSRLVYQLKMAGTQQWSSTGSHDITAHAHQIRLRGKASINITMGLGS